MKPRKKHDEGGLPGNLRTTSEDGSDPVPEDGRAIDTMEGGKGQSDLFGIVKVTR